MIERLIELWGTDENRMLALEFSIGNLETLAEDTIAQYAALFSEQHPGFAIALLERYGPILSLDDGWYLCCVQDERPDRPIAASAQYLRNPRHIKDLEFFFNLSEDFNAYLDSILGDFEDADPN